KKVRKIINKGRRGNSNIFYKYFITSKINPSLFIRVNVLEKSNRNKIISTVLTEKGKVIKWRNKKSWLKKPAS
ncbi:hypothetical protein, partial [Xanthovirga aplysinae]|uniref:hypothetical protein n=1 Tax=Xanthovirga aplysinae TaxID=2529853 RepID=UPI001CA42044